MQEQNKVTLIALSIVALCFICLITVSAFRNIELAKIEAQTKMYKAEEGHKFKFGLTKEKNN